MARKSTTYLEKELKSSDSLENFLKKNKNELASVSLAELI